jgi:hypothetical protein
VPVIVKDGKKKLTKIKSQGKKIELNEITKSPPIEKSKVTNRAPINGKLKLSTIQMKVQVEEENLQTQADDLINRMTNN